MSVQSERIEHQIVHAIPGRLRLKIPHLRRDAGYGDKLQRLVKSLSAVTDVRVNSASASMIVYYNPRSIESKVIQRELAICVWQADSNGASAIESPVKPLTETIEQPDKVIEVVSPVGKQTEDDVSTTTDRTIEIETSEEYLSQSDRFPIDVDLEQKLFEVGIPASYILQPLNAELEKFEAENEKNTESQRIKVNLEAFLREGGFSIEGRANGWFREIFFINPFTGKKHYTPWIPITAVGTAELEATVVDETINVNLIKLSVSGESGKWYKELVKYAFEYLFKTKLIAKINETLSKFDGAKIQQLFYDLKVDEKLRERSQELGLTSEKVDELLELVEVHARISSDRLWLSVHL
ncbi:hypothetical protein IQ238_12660 [Pleurocapsales cyanobacterium LEGE 06147]|nr:hypothetical protein [Pleurocapsales cyanobacterium LEGE 06147]